MFFLHELHQFTQIVRILIPRIYERQIKIRVIQLCQPLNL